MPRILSSIGEILYCSILLLVWTQNAAAQGAPAYAGRSSGSMGHGNGPSSGTHGRAGGGTSSAQPGAVVAGSPTPAAGDSSFAWRLGTNVGLRAMPAVSVPVGVGNINHPGMQPLPTTAQPFPTGPVAPYPNINFPGGTPAMNAPSMPPRWPGHHKGAYGQSLYGPQVIYYGVPYYVPYIVYSVTPAPSAADTRPLDRGPYGPATGLPQPQSQQPQQTAPTPPNARPVTLLAFKDYTIIAVVDYWLEGDLLWYQTSSGLRTSVPLAQLDLPLTQQLNRERNVRFVLESRP